MNERGRVEEAFLLASELHRGQKRKRSGIPYVFHLMAVASIVAEYGGDEDQVVAAFLHDAVEDAGGPRARETIRERFGDFVTEIVDAGAEPVLFMAWAYERLGWITMQEIAQAHYGIGEELGVAVAPVGIAWQRAMEERPDLDMYGDDEEHPSIYGTYLAVNVVYATVYGMSPEGLTYLSDDHRVLPNGDVVFGIDEEDAAFLRRVAWETVQERQR